MYTRTRFHLGRLRTTLVLLLLVLSLTPQPAYVQGPPPPPPTEPPLSEPGTGPAKETVLPTGNISGKASGAPTSPPGPELITGTDPTPEAPAGATGAALGPNCNQPPSGRQARLRAENEIAVAYRESKNKSLSYGRLNDSGSSLSWDTNIYINSPSSLTDIRWPAVTSADLNGDGTYEALMAYQDKDDNLGVYVKKASGYDTWYSSWDRHHGSIAWIDVAAGRLIPWHSTTTDSPVLAFKDDKDDLEVVCLHGASNADIATTDSHWNARYWSDSSGRGNVDHVCVATGDLNGDGYDDEIVVAFQDSSYDLQVMAFRWEGGTSLTLLWEKRWTNYGRGYVAGDIYTARGIDVTTGDVDADFQDEVVVAFADGDYKFQLLLLNNVNTQGASAISLDDSTFVQLDPARGHELVWGEGATPKSVSVAAADVDGNGKDEVILAYGTYISKWWSGSGTFPHLMTFNYVRPGMGGLQERGHTQGSVALDYYGRMSLAAGDIDMDGRAEFAYARRTEGGDLEIKSFDAENNIVYHGGNSYSCSNCDVDELMLTMGDLNGDSSYGNYTNTCYETVETQVTAVLYVPPHYSEYNRLSGGVGSCAAIGKFVGSGSSNATGATTSNAGSVTIDESISFADIFEVGPSFTYEYESSLAVSNEQAVMRTDGLHWATDANADIYDLVAFDKVTYWVYEYTESRTGETYMLRIPKSSTPSTRRLDLWYSNGPTEFPTSWVPVGQNVARGRTATQSSTWGSGTADRAVDGNADGNYSHNSVTHTNNEQYAWWQVDLSRVQWLDAIQVWNRTDCCGSRLSNFYIFVSDVSFTSNNPNVLLADPNVWNYHVTGQGGRPTTVIPNRTGRYVRVQLAGTNNLSLAEVQVWGHPAEVKAGGQKQWPTERPITIDDSTFKIKLPNGSYQIVDGQLQWSWTATGGIQVDRGSGPGAWETQDDQEWTTSTETSTAESLAIGFEAKVMGVGPEGSYTYGSETRTSRALTWSTGTLIEGQAGPLIWEGTPAGISYNYSPYLWVQQAMSPSGVQQEFLVLDYWVSTIGNPLEKEPPQPAASKGITPTLPLIASPSHPDPVTWYPTSTVVLTWTQPAGDPATVAGYRWYMDSQPDTVPGPINKGLTTTHTYQDVPDGLWYAHVRAVSDGGEWSDTAHRAVQVDTNPPQVTLALDPPLPTGNNGWYVSPVAVSVNATDTAGSGVAAVEISTDGFTWQPYAAPWHFVTDTVTTTLWARATDAVGHTSAPVTTTVKADMTPPSSKIHIDGYTIGVWIATVVTDTLGNQHLVLGGVISDSLSGRSDMNLLVDGVEGTSASAIGVWHPFPSQPQIEVNWYYTATTELGRGNHIFQGWAQDEAGNLETPYQIAQVIWFPPAAPDLSASSMAISPQVARPGDVVNVTLAARNGGQQEAWVAVTDTLPAGLTPITETLGYDVVYDPGAGTITWPAVLLWPGQWNKYTFSAQVDASLGATVLENQATAHAFWPNTDALTGAARQYFLDHEDTVVFTATVTVNPAPPADVTPPQVDLSILSGSVMSERDVTLRILADADARWMYLREWTLDPATGVWIVAQESGWMTYNQSHTWTLSPGDGVKYLGVWVADGARNVSLLDENSLAFTNLVGGSQALVAGQRVQYRFDLRAGALTAFYVTAQAGDPDLYVWNPLNAFRPNYYSNGPGGAGTVDEVIQWLDEEGLYLVEVQAVGDCQYRLTIPEEAELATRDRTTRARMLSFQEKDRPVHPLAVSDPLSAGSTVTLTVPPPYEIYLPLVFRGGVLQ